MQVALSAAVGLGRFLYRFVVGDDWRVAVVMLAALTAADAATKHRRHVRDVDVIPNSLPAMGRLPVSRGT